MGGCISFCKENVQFRSSRSEYPEDGFHRIDGNVIGVVSSPLSRWFRHSNRLSTSKWFKWKPDSGKRRKHTSIVIPGFTHNIPLSLFHSPSLGSERRHSYLFFYRICFSTLHWATLTLQFINVLISNTPFSFFVLVLRNFFP